MNLNNKHKQSQNEEPASQSLDSSLSSIKHAASLDKRLKVALEQRSDAETGINRFMSSTGSVLGIVQNPSNSPKAESNEVNNSDYLETFPEKPEGHEDIADFAENSGIGYGVLYSWMESGDAGEVQKFRNPNLQQGWNYALSPEQQKAAMSTPMPKIYETYSEYLDSLPKKPEGYEFIGDFAKNYNIPNHSLNRWLRIGKLGGGVHMYRDPDNNTWYSYALSPEQQVEAIHLNTIRNNKTS